MASMDQVELWSDSLRSRGGAVLQLRKGPEDDLRVMVDGYEVLARRQRSGLIVRGLAVQSFDEGLSTALQTADKALDILSIGGRASLSLEDPQAQNIVWHEGEGGIDLRIWAVTRYPMPVMWFQGTVKDAEGNSMPATPTPDPEWHEAFRYFRLAQVTDDLFDAFRNLYLALEALLSTVAPQTLHPSGAPSEGEGQWFRRALTAACEQLDMRRYAPKGQDEATVGSLYEEIYLTTRNAVFHAKSGRRALIPLDEGSRPAVMDTLGRLAQLVADLSEKVTGVRFLSSFWTSAGFEVAAKALVADPVISLLDADDLDINAESTSAMGGTKVDAPARVLKEYGGSFRKVVGAEYDAAVIAQHLSFVASAALGNSEGQPVMGLELEGRLDVEGVNRVRVVLGVRGVNTRMLRSDYST